jgi:hypothetical protein
MQTSEGGSLAFAQNDLRATEEIDSFTEVLGRKMRRMGKLNYSALMSLDGYIEGPDGKFDWAAPDEEVHRFINDLERRMGTYLFGRVFPRAAGLLMGAFGNVGRSCRCRTGVRLTARARRKRRWERTV